MATSFRVGTASWTDPTLLRAHFYPPAIKTAEGRLRFYAEHFDTVEVDSTYYALPNERNAALWAERTPDGFTFNIKAFALLTQHAAEIRALPPALQRQLSADALRQRRVRRPPPELLALAFELFRSALEPLRSAGKLGCVLLQFPPYFTATPANAEYLLACRDRLADLQLAVEFRHRSWLNGATEPTLALLREHQLSFVCTDVPEAPSIPHTPYVATCDTAYVRLHGHNRTAWFQRSATAAERFKYLYADEELRQAADRIRKLGGTRTTYVIFNNCYADYGVRNAATMKRLLTRDST